MLENAIKVKVCGENDPALAQDAVNEVKKRISLKDYSEDDIDYIRKLNLKLIDGTLKVDDKDLERLRHLCKVWDVELKPSAITSHRPIIGRFIVALKKFLFPIIRAFLKDSFKQQRDFNAAAVSMLAEMMNKNKNA